MRRILFLCLLLLTTIAFAQTTNYGKDLPSVQPKDLIRSFVDDDERVVLHGNQHPLARPEFDGGAVAPSYRMDRMILTLNLDPQRQQILDQLVREQQDPRSPHYHQWLTAEEYGEHFGISENDLEQVLNWLQIHGMEVEEVTAGRRAIIFSGTAAQVNLTFHTPIHTYLIGEQVHHANAANPQIPLALASVVNGVVSLHDFRSQPMHSEARLATPEFSSGSAHYLAPADFATIYDVPPLYGQSINGYGQSVAIVARSNIHLADVQAFRSMFGLPANNPQIIVNGADPGIFSSGEEVEADLDVEWAGAVAKNATIDFVVSASTSSSDGTYLSAQYIVNHNLAPVMSASFGLCEAALGSSGNSFLNSLWQQAAAEGITVFVSSGDSGAAGCDSSSASRASAGTGVNGLCSTPYSVCVGGTRFNDTSNAGAYWSSSNNSAQGSALSYIPEVVWNESTGGGLWASGGGVSTVYGKPAWQTGTGVPADGKRDVPDVSLSAAGHDGYLIEMNGGEYVVGGTSAASPSFAGLMALVVQSAAARQGNANTAFYALAGKQAAGGAAVFHDITSGNNSVPGVTGFSAGTGYDRATGLGSVDASVMVSHWSDATAVPVFQATLASSTIAVTAGSNTSTNLNVTVGGGFNAKVSFTATGLPSGVTATFAPTSLPAPGSGTSVLKLTASSTAKAGTYSASISTTSGSTVQKLTFTITVAPAPTFSLGATQTTLSVPAGSSGTVTLTTTGNSTFNSAVGFSVSGLPAGMTAVFAPATIAAPGSGSTMLTLNVSSAVAPKSYAVAITAVGGGISKATNVTVNVPGFTLAASPATASVSGKTTKGTVTLTTAILGGFASSIALSVSGVPNGVSVSLSPQSLVSPGSGRATLTVTKGTGASVGSSQVTVTASGGGIQHTSMITLNVSK